jgi:DnaJ-class molecular chaperone
MASVMRTLLLLGAAVSRATADDAAWLQGTTWHWNNWRDVVFHADGEFTAPTPECENGGEQCTWTATSSEVRINWGASGLHRMQVSGDKKSMNGRKVSTGEACSATFVKSGGALVKAGDDDDDLYAVLGVSEDADEKTIKKAFRSLSRKYHPDKNRNNPAAVKKFNEVREAYEVLGNGDKKILYDMGGLESVKQGEKEDAQGGAAANDPFAAFFGGQQKQNGGKRGPDASLNVDVTLESLYKGDEITTGIQRRVVCRRCNTKKRRKNPRCNGCGKCPNEVRTVMKQMGFMQVQQQEQVPSKERCKTATTQLTAVIEQGMKDGEEIRFPRMSEQRPGQIPGDVILKVKQKEHHLFTRVGDNLMVTMDITLKEALLGFTVKLTHLDGRVVTIARQGNSGRLPVKPEEKQVIKGEGMPVHNFPSQHGDLAVTWHIKWPAAITAEQAKRVAEIL